MAPAKKRPNSQPLRPALSGHRKIEQRTSSQVPANKGPRKQLGKENVPQKLPEKKSKVRMILIFFSLPWLAQMIWDLQY